VSAESCFGLFDAFGFAHHVLFLFGGLFVVDAAIDEDAPGEGEHESVAEDVGTPIGAEHLHGGAGEFVEADLESVPLDGPDFVEDEMREEAESDGDAHQEFDFDVVVDISEEGEFSGDDHGWDAVKHAPMDGDFSKDGGTAVADESVEENREEKCAVGVFTPNEESAHHE